MKKTIDTAIAIAIGNDLLNIDNCTYNRKHDCIDNCKNRKQVITVDKAIEIAIVNAVAKSVCNIDNGTYNCKNNSITEQK